LFRHRLLQIIVPAPASSPASVRLVRELVANPARVVLGQLGRAAPPGAARGWRRL